jgi:carbonic anhydrase
LFTDTSIAVIGFVAGLGPINPFLASVITSVSAITSPGNTTLTGPLFFAGPEYYLATNTIYRYIRSLTTPPCSEYVDWIISSKPLYIDADTYKRVKSVLRFNARYTQNGLGEVNSLQNAADELNVPRRSSVRRSVGRA